MIKVFIVEDHEILREGLKRILNDEPDMTVVAEAVNGTEVMKMISDVDCDLILLDLNLPGRSGTELISEIKKKKPKAQILIMEYFNNTTVKNIDNK